MKLLGFLSWTEWGLNHVTSQGSLCFSPILSALSNDVFHVAA